MSKLPGHKHGGKLFKKLMKREEERKKKKEAEKHKGTKNVKLKGTNDSVRLPK